MNRLIFISIFFISWESYSQECFQPMGKYDSFVNAESLDMVADNIHVSECYDIVENSIKQYESIPYILNHNLSCGRLEIKNSFKEIDIVHTLFLNGKKTFKGRVTFTLKKDYECYFAFDVKYVLKENK